MNLIYKTFKIYENPKKVYLPMQIVNNYLKGMTLAKLSKEENWNIKTAKFCSINLRNLRKTEKTMMALIFYLNLEKE